MIQGGDPNSRDKDKSTWGFGDPSQTKVPAEFSTVSHQRGIMSAARTPDPNSATSQFFICVAPATHLDGQYSVYGQVVKGMNVADTIVNVPRDMTTNNPLQKVEMTIVKLDPNGVEEIATDNSIQIYPNPVKDKLSFKSEKGLGIAEIQISDITGQIYLSDANLKSQDVNQLSIPVDGMPVGVYILKMKDSNNKVHTLRFVVE
jgi:cyclophilin family peptidyl-prolyl cis-trans isomerase